MSLEIAEEPNKWLHLNQFLSEGSWNYFQLYVAGLCIQFFPNLTVTETMVWYFLHVFAAPQERLLNTPICVDFKPLFHIISAN